MATIYEMPSLGENCLLGTYKDACGNNDTHTFKTGSANAWLKANTYLVFEGDVSSFNAFKSGTTANNDTVKVVNDKVTLTAGTNGCFAVVAGADNALKVTADGYVSSTSLASNKTLRVYVQSAPPSTPSNVSATGATYTLTDRNTGLNK